MPVGGCGAYRMGRMNLWLDDIRRPPARGVWQWVKTYDEAIKALSTFNYDWVSLDHDLADEHYANWAREGSGQATIAPREKTGYDVALWMAENNVWPREGVVVHSWNYPGADRMRGIVDRYGPYDAQCYHVPAKSMEQG